MYAFMNNIPSEYLKEIDGTERKTDISIDIL
jgi:hypothetical protein